MAWNFSPNKGKKNDFFSNIQFICKFAPLIGSGRLQAVCRSQVKEVKDRENKTYMSKKFAEYQSFNLSDINKEVLKKWDEENVFAKSMTEREGSPSFVFYEYYDDSTVIMSIISKKNVYTKRTLVLVWMTVLQFVFMLSSVLSIRLYKKDYL